jgi:hypothetical protein
MSIGFRIPAWHGRVAVGGGFSDTLRVRHDGEVSETILPCRRGRPSSWKIVLTATVLGTLLALQRKSTAPAGVVRRARTILLLAGGESSTGTAQRVGLSPRHVPQGGQRFLAQGVPALEEKPRPGRTPKFSPCLYPHFLPGPDVRCMPQHRS